MIAYVLFNKNTPAERACEAWAERIKREQVEVELVDADSPRGIQLAENYDVLSRPAVILVGANGSPVQSWDCQEGLPIPGDVAYLAHQ